MLADSREYMPHTEAYDTLTMPPEYPEIFHDVIEGDSVVIRIAADSFLKLNNNPALSFARSGGKFYTTFKILNIFKNRREADSATRVEFKVNGLKIFNKQLAKFEFDIQKKAVQIGSDAKKISDYLEGKKISYIRGNWGTFIVIHDEGSGEKIKFDNVVGINYTGKGLEDGKAFDSNIDPKFGHPGILEIHMNELQSIIPGLLDALMQLKKSSSATIYIPSSLGYGVNGVPPNIKSNENLVFEIEVKEVITEDSAMKIVSESRQRNDEVRRRMLDSLKHH
jgi:FKBP-type peptidyl-prolyl cis-trans isomerase